MSDRELVMHGPVVFELKVHIMNPDTGQRAVVTVGMGAGKYPTPDEVAARVAQLEEGELEKHAPGFELMDRREFMADLMEEHSGHRVHVACPKDWNQIED
ncbi:hypothetical protein MHM84_03510 [Halomonas sp. McH1-25]|uniref:hypothetical protein n=1 Tax=unclassified Halomonas TaxID=2609666 RepID=UPI001EF63BD0|nr:MULTISPECIES: hypothetical protein [unclassified Halomonas]MCG7598839.1 hypothetical protein [Halomonas sp. McH1-25]MCP1340802.1 hypothetical protein [Halomonas sp. FL8]MCP1362225.1 hypothetical protein [Halomonas sp. BBD45]MCP1364111.1 hypothetical protein [Halomonas sp. BBD48]